MALKCPCYAAVHKMHAGVFPAMFGKSVVSDTGQAGQQLLNSATEYSRADSWLRLSCMLLPKVME
jgi:hypothetical protein